MTNSFPFVYSVIPLAVVGAHKFYTTLTNFLGLIGYWGSCFISVVLIEHFVFRKYAYHLLPSGRPVPTQQNLSSTTKTPPTHLYSKEDVFENYDIVYWNTAKELPSGLAALGASILSFGLVVPCMDQVWFVGPIAETTGDVGFEVALVLTAVFYLPLRYLEVRIRGKI